MNERLISRLVRVLQDAGIYRIDIQYKCKTADGMIYTLDATEFHREECPGQVPYAEWVDGAATMELMHLMENVEDQKGFYVSLLEDVAIRKDQIVRIWVELGDIYTESPPAM